VIKKNSLFLHGIGISLICGALGISGCSAARPPAETLATAEFAVREASESKAPQYSPAELTMAREKLANAQQAMAAEEYEQARRLAEQALVDAQLAEAKADSEEARNDVEELRRTIESLRAEATRSAVQ
jgi:predicted S18 family serine protease